MSSSRAPRASRSPWTGSASAESIVGRGHLSLAGAAFGPVDTIFAGAGVLAIVGALYARASFGRLRLAGEPGAAPPPAAEDTSPAVPAPELIAAP